MRHIRESGMLAMLGALSLVAAACGGGDPAETTTEAAPTTTEAPATTQAPDEPISFEIWHVQTDEPELAENAIARYEEANPNVDVNVVPIENDSYKTQIRVAVGAGEQPCGFISWGGGPLAEYVEGGAVIDLTDRMQENNYADRFVDAAFSVTSIDDRIYGVPVENSAAAFFWYNTAIFDEHGLTPPQTWDEMLEIVDTLTAAGIAPFSLANSAAWPGSMYYMYFIDRLAGPELFASAANRTGGSFEDPVFIQAGEMLQDLVRRNAFVDGFNGLNWGDGESRAFLYSGDAAMELMGNWNVSIILTENEEFLEQNIGMFPFPAIEEGEGDASNVVGTIGDNFYHISSTCEHPDEVFEAITYLIDDEAVAERIEAGRIPPVKDFEPEQPLVAEVFDALQGADSVQLWYDQFLPPELAQVHLQTTQALYDLSMTPEEAAAAMEQAAVEHFGE